MMTIKPLMLILMTLATMATRSGCGNSKNMDPRIHHPSEKEWRSLVDTGQALILAMGDQQYSLTEPHFEGDIFVAILGTSTSAIPYVRSNLTGAMTKDSTDAPVYEIPPKQVILYPSVVVSARENELRLTREELSSIHAYTPRTTRKISAVAGTVILVLGLLLLKSLPLLVK